jgi:hypothetical protein
VKEINEGIPPRASVSEELGPFQFSAEVAELGKLREAGLEKRRLTNVGASNEMVMSLQRYDPHKNEFVVQPATYHDQVRSNLNMDFQIAEKGPSIRSILAERFKGAFPPLGSGFLADTIGAAVIIFFNHGKALFPYLIPRAKSMPVFPGGWHPSASGAMKCPTRVSDASRSFATFIIEDLYDEIREEIGLFRSNEEKQRYFETDGNYREHREFVGNLESD